MRLLNRKITSGFPRRININEMVFDITVSFFALFFYRLFLPENGLVLSKISLLTAFVLILSVQFFMALFLADILQTFDRYRDDCFADKYPKPGKHVGVSDKINEWLLLNPYIYIVIVILYFAGISGLYILMPLELYKIVGELVDAQRITGGMNEYLDILTPFLTGLPVLIVGLMMFKGEGPGIGITNPLTRWYGISLVPFMMFSFVWPLSSKYFAHAFGLIGGFLFMLITIPLFAGVIFLKVRSAEKKYTEIPTIAIILKPLRMIAVPFFTAVAMILWHELVLANSVKVLQQKQIVINLLNVFPLLLLSGLIPIRLVILLVPPVKPINVLISTASLIFFLTSLDKVLLLVIK